MSGGGREMKATTIILSFLFAMLCWSGTALAAQPPDLINYQGILRNDMDDPQDGDFDMEFLFYNGAGGGTCVGGLCC